MLLRCLKLLKPKYVYYLVSKFVCFGVVNLLFGRCFCLFGFSLCCFVSLGERLIGVGEMMTERADEIGSLQGTKGVYQRHTKNIERDTSELMKNLNFNNEDTIIELIALKNSYSDKVEKIKELYHGIIKYNLKKMAFFL